MDIYKQGEKLGLDSPLTEDERKDIEGLLSLYNKHSSAYRAFLRLLCAERKANN